MQVHLVDGTYELFRHFLAPRPGHRDADGVEVGATRAVVGVGARRCSRTGATHVGVATDHVIESFRNDLWAELQDRRRHRPAAARAVPAPRGRARRARRHGVADGRVRGRRRARERGRGRGRRRARRAGDHLHARQGPRPVRRRQGRAARPAQATCCSTRTACARSSACRPSRSPTSSRSSATPPTASPACPGWGAKSAAAVLARYGHLEAIPDDASAWDVAGRARRRRLAATLAAGREVAALLQGARDAAHRRAVGTVDDWEWTRPDARASATGASASDRRDSLERAAALAERRRRIERDR